MTALAEVETDREVARPLSVLSPLIKEQIQLGDLAAEEAGMPYYRKAGGLLEEARIPVRIKGNETFEEFCERVTGKSIRQCQMYIRAHKEQVAAIEHARKNGKGRGRVQPKLSSSLREMEGRDNRSESYIEREWTAPVDAIAEAARKQQLKAAEDRQAEQQRKQQLARKLIDIGFRVLAKELHPDKMGGNKEAMSRLNEVRKRLMDVYG